MLDCIFFLFWGGGGVIHFFSLALEHESKALHTHVMLGKLCHRVITINSGALSFLRFSSINFPLSII